MIDEVVKILLVDDEEDEYILTCSLLSEIEGKKYNVEWVSNCQSALEKINSNHHYDLILLDYFIGAQSGLDLLREIVDSGKKIPVILLTGQDDPAMSQMAMREGATDYLIKGMITTAQLERSIRQAIQHGD